MRLLASYQQFMGDCEQGCYVLHMFTVCCQFIKSPLEFLRNYALVLHSICEHLESLGMPSKKNISSCCNNIGLNIDGDLCFEKMKVA